MQARSDVIPIAAHGIEVRADYRKQPLEVPLRPWAEMFYLDFGCLRLNQASDFKSGFGPAHYLSKKIAVAAQLQLMHDVDLGRCAGRRLKISD